MKEKSKVGNEMFQGRGEEMKISSLELVGEDKKEEVIDGIVQQGLQGKHV